jgi:uncharacterized membrane protein
MELLFALIGLGLGTLVLLAPLFSIASFVRSRRLAKEIEGLREEHASLHARVESLSRALRRMSPAPPSPTEPPIPTEPTIPTEVPALTAAAAPESAAAPPEPPIPTAAAAPESAATPTEPPPAASEPESAAPPTAIPPPTPPKPPQPEPPQPQRPSFEWESLLGVKGAAIVGAIAVAISGLLLARLAIEAGWFTPELRVMLLLLAGVSCLLGAEFSLRRGYATQANAVCGAGVSLLYAGLFAGHALYKLIPFAPTFALMALVTAVAALLSIRYDAWTTAVLGLLGGFATPVVISTGRDNPLGLFGYLLLLNLGLLGVAVRQRWHGLVTLAFGATLLIQFGWFGRHMGPEKLLIGLGAFALFGLLFLLLPLVSKADDESGTLFRTGLVAGLAPFLFGLLIAADGRYAPEWPLLFAFLGLLQVALCAVAVARGRETLMVAAAAAVATTLPLWATRGLAPERLLWPSLAAVALALIPNLVAPLAARLGREAPRRLPAEGAGLIGFAGLALFALVMVAKDLGEPPAAFVVVAAGLLAIAALRTGDARVPFVGTLLPAAVAALAQLWFLVSTGGAQVLAHLAVPLLVAALWSLLAAARAAAPVDADDDERGAVLAALAALGGLYLCLVRTSTGREPLPLFAGLGIATVLLLAPAVRRRWAWLSLVGLLAAAGLAVSWHGLYFQPADFALSFPLTAIFYLAFLALPFLPLRALRSAWRGHRSPWFASALAGPAFFLPLVDAVERAFGKAWIGGFPLLLAALSVLALRGVAARFPVSSHPEAAAARLRYLALFAAVALGFVAVAIPLQLDRQWMTIAWALQAAAVFFLYGRLPHPGLRLFGSALFAIVGVRLLLNPDVLRYETGGAPVFNWLLYTYGVPALCCLFGARFLRAAEVARGGDPARPSRTASAVTGLGLLLVFAWLNAEVDHTFASAPESARDLARSTAWGLYAMALLVLGVWKTLKPLRYASLGFLLLTVAKVFLYDLSNLQGVYRVFSFLGLGVALMLVSLFYQRFVFRKEEK